MTFSEKLDLYCNMLKGIERDYGWTEAKKQAAGLADLYDNYKTDQEKAMFIAGLFY